MEILVFSFPDDYEQGWTLGNAIEKDGLIWDNHVSDLKGWLSSASQEYGISSIPHTILVGKDGKIIRTHLRGPALEQELIKQFSE